MRIAVIHNALLPAKTYGGTERAVWNLAKGLNELGHEVHLYCREGSACPFAAVYQMEKLSEAEADFFHYFEALSSPPVHPYLVTIEGNGREDETFLPNTSFVSKNHAERHAAEAYVYNGIDPDDYQFKAQKKDFLVFLAKASWNVKNVKGAIRFAKKSKHPLRILGGRGFPRSGIRWEGMVGGKKKTELVADAKALLFPVIWDEPFGIAITEALVSGTPVIGTPFGSLPELVPEDVGMLCDSEEKFLEAISQVHSLQPKRCREWAVEKFHYKKIAKDYERLYEKIGAGTKINPTTPHGTPNSRKLYEI